VVLREIVGDIKPKRASGPQLIASLVLSVYVVEVTRSLPYNVLAVSSLAVLSVRVRPALV